MHILTHGLASLALVRAGWPRAPRELWIAAVAAGVVADVDVASAWLGAAAWLRWHHAYTHSLLAVLVVAAVFTAGYRRIADNSLLEKFSVLSAFVLTVAAGLLHLLLDVCGWDGAPVLWPFSARRLAMDWEPNVDPAVIAVLVGALLFPELLHLVSSEIGAREKRPRGRIGAYIGFAIIALYIGMRADFHGNALALMDARSYRGEVPKRVGAFPESLSPFTWHGVVETESALHLVTVTEGPGASFDPEKAEALFKPQPSAALDAAGKTAAAELFVHAARFPKALVETTTTGMLVQLRDLRYQAAGETNREVLAVIHLDAANRVVSQDLIWAAQ